MADPLLLMVATLLGLLVFVLTFSAYTVSRIRALRYQQAVLADEIDTLREWCDWRERTIKRLSREQDSHRLLLTKFGDDIYEVRTLVPDDFDAVRQAQFRAASVADNKPHGVSIPQSDQPEDTQYCGAPEPACEEAQIIPGNAQATGEPDHRLRAANKELFSSDRVTRALNRSRAVN